jgi:hypothetical protein
MSDTILDCNKDSDNIKVVYKLPEYFAISCKNYYNKKKEDPEFIKKRREQLRVWREKNRIHVNEVERLRKQKKREEQNAKKSVPVIEPVTEDSKPVNQTDVPKDTPLDKTIVAAMENMVLNAVETVQEPEKNIEKPKAKRGRKPKCDVVI